MRPIPLDYRLGQLGNDDLVLTCPLCGLGTQRSKWQLLELFPEDRLLILIASKFYCIRCSSEGNRVRPDARIREGARSGAGG
jgi:hypothetical protein